MFETKTPTIIESVIKETTEGSPAFRPTPRRYVLWLCFMEKEDNVGEEKEEEEEYLGCLKVKNAVNISVWMRMTTRTNDRSIVMGWHNFLT